MSEPQYDGADMNRHYEFEEYRALRQRHTALLASLHALLAEHIGSGLTSEVCTVCGGIGPLHGPVPHTSACWVQRVATVLATHREPR
jgi:cytochrome c5